MHWWFIMMHWYMVILMMIALHISMAVASVHDIIGVGKSDMRAWYPSTLVVVDDRLMHHSLHSKIIWCHQINSTKLFFRSDTLFHFLFYISIALFSCILLFTRTLISYLILARVSICC